MTTNEENTAAQGDTATAGNETTGNQETDNQENLSGVGADANAQDGGNGEDNADKSGVGEPPETEEEKFAKEYVGKPEAGYDFKDIELPEGMTFNEELTDGLKDIAGKYNMSQKGANEIMSMGVKLVQSAETKLIERLTQQTTDTSKKFFEALMADPDIGGSKWEETKKVANVAYNQFLAPDAELHALLQGSGVANNKAFIKMLYEIGGRMQDGKIVSGSAPASEKSREEKLYGKSAS